ncbi:urease alpha-subunit, N-terminal-like domain protein [Bordetella pertussis STO1-CHOC-0018]|nr:urease alpha-subunit, N-terminal-like domain protein [Bordetella pertussis STO1-CHOC-0018]
MQNAEKLDFKITGGWIIDGTGAPRRRADLGVRDGRIAAIGELGAHPARHAWDASGKIVAPSRRSASWARIRRATPGTPAARSWRRVSSMCTATTT